MAPSNDTVLVCASCHAKNRVRATSAGVPRCSVCHSELPWVVSAAPERFEQEITASVPVLVDFWAPWCGPCRMVSPLVEQLGREHAGHLKVVKLNVDGIPLLVIVRGGSEVDRLVGAAPLAQLQAWLAPHLSTAGATTG